MYRGISTCYSVRKVIRSFAQGIHEDEHICRIPKLRGKINEKVRINWWNRARIHH